MGRACVLLPVLNEAANIEPLWSRLCTALAARDFVVCFVDDGSTDGTSAILERLVRAEPERAHLIRRRKMMRGSQRGSALHAALQWALRDPRVAMIVEMDGDLSHRPEELPAGLDRIASGACDIAIASKYRPASVVVNRPAARRAVSFLGNQVVRLLLTREVSDYSNGLRFYNRRAGQAIAHAQIRYGSPIYLSEVLAIWLHDGFRIEELACTYVGRGEGLSKLRPLDLVKATFASLELAWRYRTGRFSPLRASEPAAESTATSTRDRSV